MSEIERFEHASGEDLVEEALGAWVRHSDHARILAERDEEIERLKEILRANAVEEYIEEMRKPRPPSEFLARQWQSRAEQAEKALAEVREGLDPRKLRALRLELPEVVWDDAISPILAALAGDGGDA